jgi:glycosyltransferase involved in cell wall biosynthesis
MREFRSLLPKQFVNQGGDPYLFELYSRFNAATFEVHSRLKNTIGGDGDARYKKYEINWRGQILRLNTLHLTDHLDGVKPTGTCLDVIVPSYRVKNTELLYRIANLRASTKAYVRFWIVLDNPDPSHGLSVREMANELNAGQQDTEGNYFVNVLEYGANRGASYARNFGYNYSTADWALFLLDDDVLPDGHILDAYIGAIQRYPDAKVFVGQTELPVAFNAWTRMLRTCNIMFFYGIANHMTHPPWGVTANMMVRGSRHNSTIQFKDVYPKTGGGEDVDLVFQFKRWYPKVGVRTVVGVPGATAKHPWWCGGKTCYNQINGWAWGDSLCITQWPDKTFLTCPNWIEYIVFGIIPYMLYSRRLWFGLANAAVVAFVDHSFLASWYFGKALQVTQGNTWLYALMVAYGAASILSAQEITRVVALIRRGSVYSLCRRIDWNDGQNLRVKLDTQLGSIVRFLLFSSLAWLVSAALFPSNNECGPIWFSWNGFATDVSGF